MGGFGVEGALLDGDGFSSGVNQLKTVSTDSVAGQMNSRPAGRL